MFSQFSDIFFTRQFLIFVLTGFLGTFFHWTFRLLLSFYMTYKNALVGAYCLSLITGFYINKRFVFKSSSGSLHYQIVTFFLFQFAMFPVVYSLSIYLSDYLYMHFLSEDYARAASHFIAVVTPSFISFILQKFIVFQEK
jgi:putative flippase GtrA